MGRKVRNRCDSSPFLLIVLPPHSTVGRSVGWSSRSVVEDKNPNATLLCLSPTYPTGLGSRRRRRRCWAASEPWLILKKIKLIVILTFFNLLLLDWYAECLPSVSLPCLISPPQSVQSRCCAKKASFVRLQDSTTTAKHMLGIIETPRRRRSRR